MALPLWRDDEELMADLAAALASQATTAGGAADDVPSVEEMAVAGRAAFTWRRVDEELALATLVYDSVGDEALAGRVRSGGTARMLTFQTPELCVEIEVTREGLVGQLSPADNGGVVGMNGDVVGMTGAGETFDQADIDETGCFILGTPPAGPVRLTCRCGDRTLVTGWFSVP